MGGHHLVLGECTDYLTGATLEDSHDERYRQELARRLVETNGFHREEIRSRLPIDLEIGDKHGTVPVDLAVEIEGRLAMIVQYAPGSLVTRHRSVLAAGRLLAPHQIPVVVVTNGRDADVLDGHSGRVLARGLESIPSRRHLLQRMRDRNDRPISARRAEMERRVLCAYEIDGSCGCDNPQYCIRLESA